MHLQRISDQAIRKWWNRRWIIRRLSTNFLETKQVELHGCSYRHFPCLNLDNWVQHNPPSPKRFHKVIQGADSWGSWFLPPSGLLAGDIQAAQEWTLPQVWNLDLDTECHQHRQERWSVPKWHGPKHCRNINCQKWCTVNNETSRNSRFAQWDRRPSFWDYLGARKLKKVHQG